jgi:hypothetical protein
MTAAIMKLTIFLFELTNVIQKYPPVAFSKNAAGGFLRLETTDPRPDPNLLTKLNSE